MKSMTVNDVTIKSYEQLHAYEKEKNIAPKNQTRLVVGKAENGLGSELQMRTLTNWEKIVKMIGLGGVTYKKRVIDFVLPSNNSLSQTVLKLLKVPGSEAQAAAPIVPHHRDVAELGKLLETAAAAGNLLTVQKLIVELKTLDPRLEKKEVQGQLNKALQMASKYERVDIVKMLVSQNANPFIKKADDEATPLRHAMQNRDISSVKALLRLNIHDLDPTLLYQDLKFLNQKLKEEHLPKHEQKEYLEIKGAIFNKLDSCTGGYPEYTSSVREFTSAITAIIANNDANMLMGILQHHGADFRKIFPAFSKAIDLNSLPIVKILLNWDTTFQRQPARWLSQAQELGHAEIVEEILRKCLDGCLAFNRVKKVIVPAQEVYLEAIRNNQQNIVDAMVKVATEFTLQDKLTEILKSPEGQAALAEAQKKIGK